MSIASPRKRLLCLATMLLATACATSEIPIPSTTTVPNSQVAAEPDPSGWVPLTAIDPSDRGFLEDSAYLAPEMVVPIAELSTAERLYVVYGPITDTNSPDFGQPGQCFRLFTEAGGKASCRHVENAADSSPWPIWSRLIGSGYVGWTDLPPQTAYVLFAVNDTSFIRQEPLERTVTIRLLNDQDQVAATAYASDGSKLADLRW